MYYMAIQMIASIPIIFRDQHVFEIHHEPVERNHIRCRSERSIDLAVGAHLHVDRFVGVVAPNFKLDMGRVLINNRLRI
jgi:hypothetical protein